MRSSRELKVLLTDQRNSEEFPHRPQNEHLHQKPLCHYTGRLLLLRHHRHGSVRGRNNLRPVGKRRTVLLRQSEVVKLGVRSNRILQQQLQRHSTLPRYPDRAHRRQSVA